MRLPFLKLGSSTHTIPPARVVQFAFLSISIEIDFVTKGVWTCAGILPVSRTAVPVECDVIRDPLLSREAAIVSQRPSQEYSALFG